MKEPVVKFETAKLAKENGFDEFCNDVYINYLQETEFYNIHLKFEEDSVCKGTNSEHKKFDNEYYEILSAPTQSLLQKWFRDEHKIVITIEFIKCPSNNFRSRITWLDRDDLFNNEKIYTNNCTKFYEETLENALMEAFGYIKNK